MLSKDSWTINKTATAQSPKWSNNEVKHHGNTLFGLHLIYAWPKGKYDSKQGNKRNNMHFRNWGKGRCDIKLWEMKLERKSAEKS